jgi:phenylacetate-CoA ligase
LDQFNGAVSGLFLVQPSQYGVKQEPPLPVAVEVAAGANPNNPDLQAKITHAIKERLLVTAEVHLVGNNTLPRETYKSKLVDYSKAS